MALTDIVSTAAAGIIAIAYMALVLLDERGKKSEDT